MANFLDKKIIDTTLEDICSLVSKYNALIQQIQDDVVTTDSEVFVEKQGINIVQDFSLKEEVQTEANRFVEIKTDESGAYIRYLNNTTPLGYLAFVPIDETNTQIYPVGAVKIGYLNELPNLNATEDLEFIAKQHLFKELATITGVNPTLAYPEANLANSYNLVRNLEISATSTTATISIADESAGLGQCLSCYVVNNSATDVEITISSPDSIKYPQNLDTGVSRTANVITISANKEYLITFLRSKAGIWSFNILEQN